MAKVTIFTGGNPFSPSGIGSGNMSVSISVSQTFSLAATSQAKFWLAGNGVSSILITSARLIQGAKNIPVTVNGAQSFYIPATGRLSDYVSISDFALPGNVTLTVTFSGTVSAPTFSDNSNPNAPVITSAIYTSSLGTGEGLTGDILFDVEFEGNFKDSINDYDAVLLTNFSLETDPSDVIFGTGSARFVATGGNEAWIGWDRNAEFVSAAMDEGFTVSTFIKFETEFFGIPAGELIHIADVFINNGTDFTIKEFFNGVEAANSNVSLADVEEFLTHQRSQIGFGMSGWMDGFQIVKGVLWTEDFTPPSRPFTQSNELIEMVFEGSITLTSNPSAGDTLTLKGGSGGDITFTFVDHYPNNSCEIQIEETENDTAISIATAINHIPGAEFTATAVDNVISITAYSTAFSMVVTGDSLTLGIITQMHGGLLTEEINADDSFTAMDGGKAIKQHISVANSIDGLIDDISENVNVADSFDTPLDSINESVSVSTNFDGLIDMMGYSND